MQSKIINTKIALFVSLALSTSVYGESYTLNDVHKRLDIVSSAIKSSRANVDYAVHTMKAVDGLGYPKLSLSSAYIFSGQPNIDYHGDLPALPTMPTYVGSSLQTIKNKASLVDVGTLSLSAIMPIDVFGKLNVLKDISDQNVNIAKRSDQSISNFEHQKINLLYYGVAFDKQKMQSIYSEFNLLNRILTDVDSMFKNGFASRLDVDRVKTAIADLSVKKSILLNTIKEKEYELSSLVNEDAVMGEYSDLVVTSNSLTDLYKSIPEKIGSERNYQFAAFSSSNVIKNSASELKISRSELKLKQETYLPDLTLFASKNFSASNELNLSSNDFRFGLMAHWNLFDPSRSESISASENKIVSIKELGTEKAREINVAVNKAYTSLVTSLASRSHLEDNLKHTKSELFSQIRRFKKGFGTLTDVLLARTAVSKADEAVAAQEYTALVSYSSLVLLSSNHYLNKN